MVVTFIVTIMLCHYKLYRRIYEYMYNITCSYLFYLLQKVERRSKTSAKLSAHIKIVNGKLEQLKNCVSKPKKKI